MDKIITDEAHKQIQTRIEDILFNLTLLNREHGFNEINIIAGFIKNDAELMIQFADTMVQWGES